MAHTAAATHGSTIGAASECRTPPSRDEVSALFSPYQRSSPRLDAYEYVKTALAAVFLLPFRAIFLLVAMAAFWIIAFAAMIRVNNKDAFLYEPLSMWRNFLLKSLPYIARAALFVSFGIYNIGTSSIPDCKKRPSHLPASVSNHAHVIVANHLGYLDVLVLFAKYNGSFVAKEELETTRIVGTVATALQCMFVREGQSLTTQLITRVQNTLACHRARQASLENGCPGCPTCMKPLIIFPEGTTCNGTAMVPFRTGVFNAGVPVRPVGIRFPHKHFNLSWESISFRHHLFRAMTQIYNNIELLELPVHVPTDAEVSNPAVYAQNVQASIAAAVDLPIVPLNRKHKLLYHEFLLGMETDTAKVFERAAALTEHDHLLRLSLALNLV
jgi:lysophosphatidylcholine acyltransferase / lyso-PAF acetyltransferase